MMIMVGQALPDGSVGTDGLSASSAGSCARWRRPFFDTAGSLTAHHLVSVTGQRAGPHALVSRLAPNGRQGPRSHPRGRPDAFRGGFRIQFLGFGGFAGGFCCADPLENLLSLPQANLRLGGAAGR